MSLFIGGYSNKSRSDNPDVRPDFLTTGNFDLADFKIDRGRIIVRDKLSSAQRIEDKFDASSEVIGVEEGN
jgi:hypothetical protein